MEIRIAITDLEHAREREIRKWVCAMFLVSVQARSARVHGATLTRSAAK